MDLWKSITGMLEVELTSASVENALDAISRSGMTIYHVQFQSDLTVSFSVLSSDWSALEKLTQKRGETLKITHHKGIFWTFQHIAARPMVFWGVLVLVFGTIWLPRHVLFVQVEGNTTIPASRIMESAEECGICFGAARSHVRSERVKNALLSRLPELQWAGVNTKGCVAVISVREKTLEKEPDEKPSVSSIVASRDGIVTECTAARGTLLCTQGQAVRQGEKLISGYTDCGISIQATAAEGEIFAETRHQLYAVTPKEWRYRAAQTQKAYRFSLLLGKKRINLWKDSGIWDTSCDRMYEEYYVVLPGGFRLPVALCVEVCGVYETDRMVISESAVTVSFREFAKTYLSHQMIAGKILSQQDSVITQDDLYIFCGSYLCSEMIGRVQPEEIGEEYGKAD